MPVCCCCREDWLAQLIAELDDTDSYEFVKHLTDVHRLHLFDIVMQYRAIFFDSAVQVNLRGWSTCLLVELMLTRHQWSSQRIISTMAGMFIFVGLCGGCMVNAVTRDMDT